jgi:hypothetical protein
MDGNVHGDMRAKREGGRWSAKGGPQTGREGGAGWTMKWAPRAHAWGSPLCGAHRKQERET